MLYKIAIAPINYPTIFEPIVAPWIVVIVFLAIYLLPPFYRLLKNIGKSHEEIKNKEEGIYVKHLLKK